MACHQHSDTEQAAQQICCHFHCAMASAPYGGKWVSEAVRSTGIFGSWAADYARLRPTYPPALFAALRELVEAGSKQQQQQQQQPLHQHQPLPLRAAELGCGTGLATFGLADAGFRVAATDYDADMVAQAQEELSKRRDGTLAAAGDGLDASPDTDITFSCAPGEATGLEGGVHDLVLCCQAWHWLKPEPALAEVARLLRRPGGVFAAVWNDRSLDSAFVRDYEALIERFNPAYDRSVRQCDKFSPLNIPSAAAVGMRAGDPLVFDNDVPMSSAEHLWELSNTLSYVRCIEDGAAFKDALVALVHRHFGAEQPFVLPFKTRCFIMHRTSD